MAVPLSMPQFGQSVVEGTVSAWLKAEGDAVVRDEALLTVSTDKIDTDLPAPASGTLLRICVQPGATVAVGTVLAYVGEAGEAVPEISADAAAAAPAPEPSVPAAPPHRGPEPQKAPRSASDFLSPVVARMAQEHQVDLTRIRGTGRGGRITRKDVMAAVRQQEQAPVAPIRPEGPDLQPLTPMRRAIATHMTQSVRTSPHVTTIFEVDMAGVVQDRATRQAAGERITYLPYVMQAAVAALQRMPQVNARYTDEGILTFRHVHLGVAIAVPDGLVVPVVRHAESLDLPGLGQALERMTRRARTRILTPDDITDGTFTITNHGAGGSLAGTPIIHQPQAAILGLGAIVKRPVVIPGSVSLLPHADDVIAIRPMCLLSLSFDHRVLDGETADMFLAHVRDTLQAWSGS